MSRAQQAHTRERTNRSIQIVRMHSIDRRIREEISGRPLRVSAPGARATAAITTQLSETNPTSGAPSRTASAFTGGTIAP